MVGARLRILLLLQQQEQRRTEGQSLFARQSDGVTGKMTGQERKSMDSGKEVNGKEVNGDFTAERHAPQCERRGLSPTPAGPPVTSRILQRTGTTLPLTPEEGERRVRGFKSSQGRDFTPERRSAHVSTLVTSRVVQRTTATLARTIDSPNEERKRGHRCRFCAEAVT